MKNNRPMTEDEIIEMNKRKERAMIQIKKDKKLIKRRKTIGILSSIITFTGIALATWFIGDKEAALNSQGNTIIFIVGIGIALFGILGFSLLTYTHEQCIPMYIRYEKRFNKRVTRW